MALTLAPVSPKQGQLAGKLQDAQRLYAELGLLIAEAVAKHQADPTDYDRIGNLTHDASMRGLDLGTALDGAFSLSADLGCEKSDAEYERKYGRGAR